MMGTMSENTVGWRYVTPAPSITVVAAIPDREAADKAVKAKHPDTVFGEPEPLNPILLRDIGVPAGEVYQIP